MDGAFESTVAATPRLQLRQFVAGDLDALAPLFADRHLAFERHGLQRVISIVEPANRPSIRVAEKNGMHPERETVFRGRAVVIYAVRRQSGGVECGHRWTPP